MPRTLSTGVLDAGPECQEGVRPPDVDDMGKTFGERFREAREAKGMSQRELGRRVGCSGSAISQWESGNTDPERISAALLEQAAGEVGRPLSYLLTGKRSDALAVAERGGVYQPQEDVRFIPVIDLVQAGSWTETTDPYPRGQGMETVGLDASLASSSSRLTFGLVIDGDSMSPEFAPGDLVIIDPAITPRPGDFVVAKRERDSKATFKKYRARGASENGVDVFDLVPLNEDFPVLHVSPDDPGSIVGVMVEHRRRRRVR